MTDLDNRKKYDAKTVLVVYGGPDEHHEIAVQGSGSDDDDVIEGSDVSITTKDGLTILGWAVSDECKVVKVHNDLYIYLLSRCSVCDRRPIAYC